MSEPRERIISAIDGEPDISTAPETARDVGDIRSIKIVEKETKSETQVLDEWLRTAMLDERGRRWFFKLLEGCGILHNPFSTDALRTAFACGEMNIGQQILIQLQRSCPDLYLQMMEENNG